MRLKLFLSFLKLNYKGLIVSALLMLVFIWMNYALIYGIFLLISIFRDYYHHHDRLIRLEKLRAKGLTEEDVTRIDFVKRWDETRQRGIQRYCIVDGGFINGALLGLFINIVVIMIKGMSIFDGPSRVFQVIGFCYLGGAIIAAIAHRILWTYYEDKFKTATDPFHKTLSSKTEY